MHTKAAGVCGPRGIQNAFSELLKIESKLFIPCNSYIGFIKEGFGGVAAFCARVILFFSGSLAWKVFDDQLFLGVKKKKIILGIIFSHGILSVLHECIISRLLAFLLAHSSQLFLSSAAFSSIIS